MTLASEPGLKGSSLDQILPKASDILSGFCSLFWHQDVIVLEGLRPPTSSSFCLIGYVSECCPG